MSLRPNNHRYRKNIILLLYISLILVIFFRYFKLQILDFSKYQEKAGNNSLRRIELEAPRGIIYDLNHKPIVDNKFIYDLNIIPEDFNSNTFNYDLIDKIANIKRHAIDSIVSLNSTSIKKFKPVLIGRNINIETKSKLEENKLDLKGLYFSNSQIRTYMMDCNLSHVLGYLRKKDGLIGFSGVEKYYQDKLKGVNGIEYHKVDRFSIDQGIFDCEGNILPIQGDDLHLTIDSDLQSYSESLMGNNVGSVIVMDPESGEVLTMLSKPDYDLSSFAGEIPVNIWNEINNNNNKPFNNRSIQNYYPPGSIFKLVLSAIVLDKNLISTNRTINCNGVYEFYDTKFRCWKEDGHGKTNLNKAIQQSCNIYFYNLIQMIDIDIWSSEVKKFGFGDITNIDLNEEKKGVVPDRSFMNNLYKDKGGWSTGHLLNLSIGQGEVMVTPIQIVNLINIIQNEGYAISPHLNKNNNSKKNVIKYDKKVWKIIKQSMYDAVNKDKGTAYKAKINKKGAKVYGKTGTAQICSNCDILPHAWFAGFLELNQKKYSIVIIIENGGKGSNLPSIMARKIFQYIADTNV
jgi:penicillin-binding protein 2